MASSATPMECGICLENYDTKRRPKVLPCGHNLCSNCLQRCMTQGGNKCSICRRVYRATSVDEIPTNNDLEKIIEMLSAMAVKSVNTAKTNELNDDDEDDFSKGRCPRHRRSLLYFNCKTHKIDICRECSVIEHSPSKCDIIDIRAEFMKNKEKRIKKAQPNIDFADSALATLETIFEEKKKNINDKEAQIEVLLKENEENNKVCDQTKKELAKKKKMVRKLKGSIESLKESSTKKKIKEESSKVEKYCRTTGKLVAELNEKLFPDIILKDPKFAAKIMRVRRLAVYAVELEGQSIIRSSKILPLPLDGGLRICSLEEKVRPTRNAIIIPMSSLLLNAGEQPVVYLGLHLGFKQELVKPLGRLRIRLTCGPQRREQMLRLCTGQKGLTWKGLKFGQAWGVGRPGEIIQSWHWYQNPDNCRDGVELEDMFHDKPLVQDLEKDKCKRFTKGVVTGIKNGARFFICTRALPSNNAEGFKLGQVESGLELLREAMSNYSENMSRSYNFDDKPYSKSRYYSVSNINFSEIGIEITS